METLADDDDPRAVIAVISQVGVEGARRLVRAFCLAAGMPRSRTEDVVLATSELATNLVRHSTAGGTIRCRRVELQGRDAIEIEALDAGPGIIDLLEAQRDGFSTRGKSLGGGLSSARHLVDDFQIESQPDATKIRLRTWLPRTS